MIDSPANQHRIAVIGFCIVLVLAWFCYRPGIGGAFQLDDTANLGGLAMVSDTQSAFEFIISGTSGPTGRPLALATFAWQAESWQEGAAAFLIVNVLIHLFNAVLLWSCLRQLAVLRQVARHRATIIASVAAGAWVLMPLLATASLLAVQRMTTLSTSFMLAGLAGYLVARGRIVPAPSRALIGMSISLVVGTALATLSKETGLLLPVFVLVVELTLLERPQAVVLRRWRVWQAIFLVLPLGLLLAYLATRVSYPDWIIARRGFDVGERLMTEARLLWLYLFKAFVGIPSQLGIFQQPPAVSRSLLEPVTLLASLGWVAAVGAALFWRQRFPLASFAVLWYLAGHLLESSVIPLELYFEHRNYMPIIGPLFAMASMLLVGSARRRKLAAGAIPLYLCLSAYFLFSFASLWGEPSLGSRYWAIRYPHSVRAVTTMATYQLAEEGPLRALQTLDNFVIAHPQHAYLRIQELNLLCMIAADQDHGQVLDQLESGLPEVDFTYTAGAMLSELFSTSISSPCSSVDAATVRALADRLRANPRYRHDPLYNQFHYKLLAGIARYQGNYAATIDNLEKAIAYLPSSELNMMMVTALGGAGDFDAAQEFIEDAVKRSPANPIRAVKWRRDLEGLRAYIRELETRKP